MTANTPQSAPDLGSNQNGRAALARRWVSLALGMGLLSVGVTGMISADVGVASWQVLETGIVRVTGWSFGTVIVLESLAALALAWIWLGQKPGPATFIAAFIIGPSIGLLLPIGEAIHEVVPSLLHLLVSSVILALALGFYIAADLGASAQDAMFVGLYERYPMKPGTARILLDGTLVLAGWSIGGQLGWGTIVVTALIPLIVGRCLRLGSAFAGTRAPS